ncbi:MAG: hypothetical protein WKG00_41065 [Polyangiaceae bacterium]
MARLKRTGRVETFSVSVSPETKTRLRRAAKRSYGGNVSALIEAIAIEADRHEALEWLLDRAPAIDEHAYAAFLSEMSPPKKKPARRAA